MEAGAIVGIVVGSVALLLIVGYLVYVYWWRPYQNKTRHAAGDQDFTLDERQRQRHRLMSDYGISDADLAEGNVTMDQPGDGWGEGRADNAFRFEDEEQPPPMG